jgi:HEAT repeat protein
MRLGGLLFLSVAVSTALGGPPPASVVKKEAAPATGNSPASTPASQQTAELRAEREAMVAEERLLQRLRVPVDGPGLLAYLRSCTLVPQDVQPVAALIRQLGDEDFALREKAHAQLLTYGPRALKFLRQAEQDRDPERRQRAVALRQQIEERTDPAVQLAVIHLLGVRRPQGAVEALLNYLPQVDNETVQEEIFQALSRLALREGQIAPALRAALHDPQPLRRAAAAVALAAVPAALAEVRALLHDPDPLVRTQVALTLVRHADPQVGRSAVPVLIQLLAEAPAEYLDRLESVLRQLAPQGPEELSSSDPAARQAAVRAWSTWWQQHQDKVDLARLRQPPPLLGYTVFVQQAHRPHNGFLRMVGEVVEVDAQGKERWRCTLDGFPVDVRVLGNDRLLLTEYHQRRITERDFQGRILWQYQVPSPMLPLSAQRLANGRTFIVSQNRLLEVDRQGREVWSYERAPNIFRACKLPSGQVVFITAQGRCVWLDPRSQQEIRSFPVGPVGHLFGSIDVTPTGHVLVPFLSQNQVVEYDRNGKVVRQWDTPMPNAVMALSNGHLLVSSLNTRQIVELNRQGQVVWSHVSDGQQIFVARRR